MVFDDEQKRRRKEVYIVLLPISVLGLKHAYMYIITTQNET